MYYGRGNNFISLLFIVAQINILNLKLHCTIFHQENRRLHNLIKKFIIAEKLHNLIEYTLVRRFRIIIDNTFINVIKIINYKVIYIKLGT